MLRIVTLIAAVSATELASQSVPTHETHGALIDDAFSQAETYGQDLSERIELFEKRFNLPKDLAKRALDSMDDERVRALFGLEDVARHAEGGIEGRYDGGVFVFASFSMPDVALKQLFRDASRLNVPVVFNGFVDNSVIETEKRVRAVYEEGEDTSGFIIDPTLFTRFGVSAVPTLVTTTDDLDVCLSTDCSSDPTPEHHRASGNVPLPFLLGVIAKANDTHSGPARAILGMLQ